MSARARLLVLILIMTVVVVIVTVITNYVLYRAAVAEGRERLIETAQSQARLMEAMARFDAEWSREYPGGGEAATLSQIIAAHEQYKGFGETGEFTLARREGDSIVFLLSHRHYDLANPQPVPFESELAEPMRAALSGQSGTLTGLDYRGEVVLAAYEPVAALDLGLVAKIDMAEVRAPFVRAAIVAGSSGVAVVLLGALLFVRVSNPMIRRLREYADRLEEMVDARTRELKDAQESLVRQERLAALGQVAGSVGHELRNPLGVIKNVAYYLRMILKEPGPKVEKSLDQLDREVARSDRIIGSLLDFARKKPLALQMGDVNDVIAGALSWLDVPDNTKVVTKLDDTLPLIPVDPDQLAQVFSNIALNAFQAMPGGGRLTVKSERSGPEWVAVSFADTGAGLSPENLEKVFQPLFTTRAMGIGLGLALSKTIVDGHGGSIDAQSELGKGSTFTVRLPVDDQEKDL